MKPNLDPADLAGTVAKLTLALSGMGELLAAISKKLPAGTCNGCITPCQLAALLEVAALAKTHAVHKLAGCSQ